MKKWNRILAAVLTLSLTAGLTACGGSTSDATANNASAADEGTASNGSSEVYRTSFRQPRYFSIKLSSCPSSGKSA